MKVTLKWLEYYFKEKLDGKEIENILTKLGLEVENRERLDAKFSKIVVGRIESLEKHLDADKLQICVINVGQSENLQIVTGAQNVFEGMYVPVALVGASIVGGEISESKLRGVPSYGMLCSGTELGIDNSLLSDKEKDGILPLSAELELGMEVSKVFSMNDEILELGLTPNRADCYGIYNVAKEIVLKKDYNLMELEYLEGKRGSDGFSVEIKSPELCHRYIARIVKNVKIETSPLWFANLLRNVGVRPINNIVDITNYVMFELGHPMHAFDYDKLEGSKIVVELAVDGDNFKTLDEQDRKLDSDMLLIKDGVKDVALAGVMGGFNSEVDGNTKNILFEAAHFNSASIRRTSRKLGLRSEASGRFERGLSEDNVLKAMNRAMYLVELLGAGEVDELYYDSYPVVQTIPTIKSSVRRVNSLLGMDIPKDEIVSIYKKLKFKIEEEADSDTLLVTPEAHRIDVQSEIDLVEEIVRIYGYENIPATLPVSTTNTLKVDYNIKLVSQIKSYLADNGFNEIISYSFIDKESYKKCGYDFEGDVRLKVMNPLSETQSYMREKLLPGIIEIASRNYKRQRRNINIFEIGRVYSGTDESLPIENLQLGIFILENELKEWYGKTKNDFYNLKGILERLVAVISNKALRFEKQNDMQTLHPGRSAVILADNEPVGSIGEIHPEVLAMYDIKEKAYYLELDLRAFSEPKIKQYAGLPKYPSIERDMAVILPKEMEYGNIYKVIKDASNNMVVGFRIFDIFEGIQIGNNVKSVALSLTYQNPEKTMTDEEVSQIHNSIVDQLVDKLGARLR
ncbi:MAG: phenylalanyl-tRNA synthetase beta chain [Fusobacteria bacterium]|nr:MAG: phenylalanyl-tRNA synthetase beta chain [Fusobacteriota bacterium]KAF0229754.1 MAG: phenylalanyl-tRNA synthetase beta [Fusobacteriota bacterium]